MSSALRHSQLETVLERALKGTESLVRGMCAACGGMDGDYGAMVAGE